MCAGCNKQTFVEQCSELALQRWIGFVQTYAWSPVEPSSTLKMIRVLILLTKLGKNAMKTWEPKDSRYIKLFFRSPVLSSGATFIRHIQSKIFFI